MIVALSADPSIAQPLTHWNHLPPATSYASSSHTGNIASLYPRSRNDEWSNGRAGSKRHEHTLPRKPSAILTSHQHSTWQGRQCWGKEKNRLGSRGLEGWLTGKQSRSLCGAAIAEQSRKNHTAQQHTGVCALLVRLPSLLEPHLNPRANFSLALHIYPPT